MDGADADERTWLTSTDIKVLLQLAAPRIGPRKLGHFFVACAEALLRQRPPADRSTAHLPAIWIALDENEGLDAIRQQLNEHARDEEDQFLQQVDERVDRPAFRPHVLARCEVAVAAAFLADAFDDSGWRWWRSRVNVNSVDWSPFEVFDTRRVEVAAAHLPHLLCITGNPFRPVAFDPSWRTEAVVALARGMYEARDFAPMPVLADALEDAGCAADAVLAHCRTPGVHVRGCWVVDGVLGKA